MKRCLQYLLLLSLFLGQMTYAQHVSYTYDSSGNRTTKTTVGASSLMSLSVIDNAATEEDVSEPQTLLPANPSIESLSAEAQAQIDNAIQLRNRGSNTAGIIQKAAPATYEVGSIPMQSSVSPSGGRLYSIPIITAPGFDLVPQVSLTYSSQSGNGTAGYGWDLSGVSCISIRSKTQYYDGQSSQADVYAPSPSYSLDGEPLVPHTVQPSSYTLETARSHVFVKELLDSTSGRKIFKACYPDGRVRTYGSVSGDAHTAEYPVLKEEDRLGNEMTFEYDWIDGVHYLKRVRYGSSAKMEFTYTSRPDTLSNYVAGLSRKNSRLLKSIVSFSDFENRLLTYTLSHDLRNGVSLLTSVGGFSGQPGPYPTSLPPLTFTYAPSGPAKPDFSVSAAINLGQYLPTTPEGLRYVRGKLYPDSYRDALMLYPLQESYTDPVSVVLACEPSAIVYSTTSPRNLQSAECVDIDGNGQDEAVLVGFMEFDEDAGTRHTRVDTYTINREGTFPEYSNLTVVTPCHIMDSTLVCFQFGDFLGNGKTQMACIQPCLNQWAAFGVMVSLVDLSDGHVLQNLTLQMPAENFSQFFGMDIDSDGRSELCLPTRGSGLLAYVLGESAGGLPALTFKTYYGLDYETFTSSRWKNISDINGDGNIDVVIAPSEGSGSTLWKVYKFTGHEFVEESFEAFNSFTGCEFMLMDINKDGMQDLIRKTATTLEFIPNRNGHFSRDDIHTSAIRITDAHILPCNAVKVGALSDFVLIERDNVSYYAYSEDFSVSRQLTIATDSYGVFTADNYQDISLASSTAYTTDGTREYSIEEGLKRQRVPLRVLASSSTLMPNPSGGTPAPLALNAYSYRDAVFSTQGLGFLGFGGTTVRDNLQGTVTDQRNDPSIFGLPTDVEVTLSGPSGTPVSETHNTYDRHSTPRGKLSPRLQTTRTIDHLTGNVSSSDVLSYDLYDNPLSVSATAITADAAVPDTLQTWTETRYSNIVTSDRIILGLPRWQLSSAVRRGPSVVGGYDTAHNGLTLTEYDPGTLLPAKVQTFASGDTLTAAPAAVTLYTYDFRGRVTSEKSAVYGASQPEAFVGSTYTYTPDGRFPATSTDALGRTTTYYGYNVWGQPESVTDHRGNTVTYTYNTLGRKTAESRPDGSSETTSYSWSGSGTGAWQVTVSGSDGSSTTTRYDAAGRVISTSTLTFDGATRTVSNTYDQKGRPYTETLPYLEGGESSAPRYRLSYDAYGRRTRKDLLAGGSASAPVVKSSVTSYNGAAVTTSSDGVTSTKYMSAGGEVLLARDAGGDIRYRYDGHGQLRELIACSAYGPNLADTTRLSYDIYGRRTSIDDSSAGLRSDSYTTNADGSSVTVHTSPSGTTTTYTDRHGRTTRTVTSGPGGFTTDFAYDSADGSLPESVTSTNGSSTTYSYDSLGRLLSSRETAPGGRWLEKTVSYSPATGLVDSVSYSSHRGHLDTERMSYSHGETSIVSADGGLTVMELLCENALGQPTSIRTGTVTRTYGFDPFGLPTSRTMGTVQDFSYTISPRTGNLSARTDGTRSISESFTYDNLDRLMMAADSGFESPGRNAPVNPIRYSYSASGNRTYATYVGSVQYSNPESPYRATSMTPHPGTDPGQDHLMVAYTAYDRPLNVNLPAEVYSYVYNAEGERVQMTNIIKASGPARTRHWMDGGRYEIDSTSTCVREIFYLGGTPYSAPMAKVRENGGEWTVYNIGRDYQGSITHLATSDGTLVAEYSYDPWGRLRDPGTHVNYEWDEVPELLLGRGYTGHEHLSAAGLVIMNARLYDPWLGRFLSPDPYVQAPDFTQSLNRYSYCLNNPLKYTDESGKFFVIDSFLVGLLSGWINGGFRKGINEGGRRAWHDLQITAGYFAYDKNKSFGGNVKAFFSRLGKESLQTVAGWITAQAINIANIRGGFTSIKYKYGATVMQMGNASFGAFTLGSFIIGDKSIQASISDPLFQHEYGHYLQSQELGFSYLTEVGIPSILNAKDYTYAEHNAYYTEQDANARAFMYFSKYSDKLYYYDSSTAEYKFFWDFKKNIINGLDPSLNESNIYNTNALSNALFTDEKPEYFPFSHGVNFIKHSDALSKRFMLSRNY